MINTNALQPKVKLESHTLPLIAAASQLDALFAGSTPPKETRRTEDACHGETDSHAVGSMANGTAKGVEASQDGPGSVGSHRRSWNSSSRPGIYTERS
jgi:hypothetical protein